MKKKTVSILESQFDSLCVLSDVNEKWSMFEYFGKLQLGRMKVEDINNIEDEHVKSNLIQYAFYINKNKHYQEIGSKGGKATQEKNRDNAKAMLKQCSSNAQSTLEPRFNQYKDKYKDKVKDKKKSIYIPNHEELFSYAKSINCDEQIAKDFYKHYSSVNWYDKNGKPITDWKSKLKWWNEQNIKNRSLEDSLPKYDTSKNVEMSEEEKERILALVKKDKEEAKQKEDRNIHNEYISHH